MKWIRSIYEKILPQTVRMHIGKISLIFFDGYAKKSYSQDGEDLALVELMGKRGTPGFYVDVGACHPKRISNTFLFYKKGWRGINIEPNFDVQNLFRKLRRRDINVQSGVSDKEGSLDYYMFVDSAYNTFDRDIAMERKSIGCKMVKVVPVKVQPLSVILAENIPKGQKIDFLSIDTEGFDCNVLLSNDWSVYRPDYIVVEHIHHDKQIGTYLESLDYDLVVQTRRSGIFQTRG